MRKKIFFALFILFSFVSVGIIYLNNYYLPIKIKSLVIASLQEATQKKVNLQNLEFNIFKGLVLRNLALYDGTEMLLSIKEASCGFLILPILKKKLIIPSVNFNSAVIFLQRKSDNTFNLMGLFHPSILKPSKVGFGIFVSKVNIRNSRLNFQDDMLSPAFLKSIENLNLIISFSLPASIKFSLKSEIPAKPNIKISASGEFKIPDKQLVAQVNIRDFSFQEFLLYYQNFGFSLPEGITDVQLSLNFKDKILNANLQAQNRNVGFSKDKIMLKLNSDIKAELRYTLVKRELEFWGTTDIIKANITGLGLVGDIVDINGKIEFNDSGLSANNLSASVLGIPVQAKINLVDFRAPIVQLELFSKDLSLESGFLFKDRLVTLSKCNGKYLNSEFTFGGTLNWLNSLRLESNINGRLITNLKDLKVFLEKFKEQLEKINPEGIINAKFDIKGNLRDFKSCVVGMTMSSPSISAYGLRATDFTLNYRQADGLAEVGEMHLALYDGTVEAGAKTNLNLSNLPYWINANIQGVKIEKLKKDTPIKEKDIAGILQAEAQIKGLSNDLSKLSGTGKIFVSQGKLWQLNLFKGLGELLFSKDFANIIFSEGACRFIIQDKYIFSDNLELKSNSVNLSGPCKIGFDGSIDASINIEVLDESVPLSGTLKDVTTAILAGVGRFGVIKISGHLREPKYKFQPVVVDIIKGLKDAIFGKP